MIRYYLQLVRFPGIFTVFTNILLGYSVVGGEHFGLYLLGPLLTTSGCLFLAGMSLNDYFDYEIDKKERPQRPLPSGKISRKNALFLGIIFLVTANIVSRFVGLETVIVTIVMSVLIFSYDFKTKNFPIIGILTLSTIRFLNVILGTSIAFNSQIVYIAIPLGIFVAGISVFARSEGSAYSRKSEILNLIFIFATIVTVIIIIFDKMNIVQLGFLGLFIVSVFFPYVIFKDKTMKSVQKKITYQLLAITILDATILSAFAEIYYAFIALLLYVPAYFIIRKLYIT